LAPKPDTRRKIVLLLAPPPLAATSDRDARNATLTHRPDWRTHWRSRALSDAKVLQIAAFSNRLQTGEVVQPTAA
jgi:hypothetical protein